MLEGVDTSMYQGAPDWDIVKKSGKRFAIIKATEGTYGTDPQFQRSWEEAKRHGLIRIAYHFFRSNEDGAQQAAFHHSFVRSHGKFSIGDGVMLDHETMDGASGATALHNAEEFVREILKSTHAGVFYYVGFYFWHDTLGNPLSTTLARCPLVEPSFGAKPIGIRNWPHGLTIWQYSETGSVPGINGNVDLDRAYCDEKTLKLLCSKGGRN